MPGGGKSDRDAKAEMKMLFGSQTGAHLPPYLRLRLSQCRMVEVAGSSASALCTVGCLFIHLKYKAHALGNK